MPKQMQIPGTERKSIQEIDEKSSVYVRLRDKRLAVLKEELTVKAELIELMKSNRLKSYVTEEDEVVELKPGKEKLKVHPLEDEGDESDEDADS